ncbi:MAG: T9SS type A sorting domain-containing protein [bacterium]
MKKTYLLVMGILGILSSIPIKADTTYVSGNISTNTVWDTTGSPYIVVGNICIEPFDTLTIEHGVEVKLDSMKYIDVYGTLNAIGIITDSIFITRNGNERWAQIRFRDGSTGHLCYCRIEYAGGSAIYDKIASSLLIEHNTITKNFTNLGGGGIYTYGSPTIIENTFTEDSAMSGGAIWNCGLPTISKNTIIGNFASASGGGICSDGDITINNNILIGNHALYGGSICSLGGLLVVKYNTIIDNAYRAITCQDSAFIDSNNLYAGGHAVCNYSRSNINARYNYWATNNTDTIDMKIWDFYDDSTRGIVYYKPFLTDSLKFGIEEKKIENIKTNLAICPNPSFGNSMIKYGLPEKATVSLTLYDISGRLVQTMYSGTQKAGDHTININDYKIAKGIYFAKLNAGDFKETKKLILMK